MAANIQQQQLLLSDGTAHRLRVYRGLGVYHALHKLQGELPPLFDSQSTPSPDSPALVATRHVRSWSTTATSTHGLLSIDGLAATHLCYPKLQLLPARFWKIEAMAA